MLKPKIQDASNSQLNAELDFVVFVSFDGGLFRGQEPSAAWPVGCRPKSREEWGHAAKIYDYIIQRSGRVHLGPSTSRRPTGPPWPRSSTTSYRHECKITGLIDGLMKLAESRERTSPRRPSCNGSSPNRSRKRRQVLFIVEKLKMMGESHIGLVILDGELGKRAGD